nr:MAG TPA: hypothetical protein [Caudoviricetes sp.]
MHETRGRVSIKKLCDSLPTQLCSLIRRTFFSSTFSYCRCHFAL